MKIKLSNGYYIEIDPLNFTLKQTYEGKRKTGDKKEAERLIGYYGNIEDALESFLKHNQIDFMEELNVSMDLNTYLKSVQEANIQAVEAIKCMLDSLCK